MGEDAETDTEINTDQVEDKDELEETSGQEDPDDPDKTGGPGNDPDESGDDNSDDDLEVVRVVDEGTQPDKQQRIDDFVSKRLRRERKKTDAVTQETNAELGLVKQELQLTKLALEQAKVGVAPKIPNPDDFDDGFADPKYQSAFNTYQQGLIQDQVQKLTASVSVPAKDTEYLVRAKRRHYELAVNNAPKDYMEIEDAVIDVLGEEVVDHLILADPHAYKAIYFLGKNSEEVHELGALFKTGNGDDAIKATLRIGGLLKGVKFQKKSKSKPAPEPDDELEGGTPSASDSVFQTRFEKAIVQAGKDGEAGRKGHTLMNTIQDEARVKGVTLRL